MDITPTDIPRVTIDPGPAIQDAAQQHLDRVWAAFFALEEDPQAVVDNPAVEPFCGCDTCCVRETIAGAWPVIEAYFTSVAPSAQQEHEQDGDEHDGE